MKPLLIALLTLSVCRAGETSLTVVYQPLNGFGAGDIQIRQVACQDFYSHSGMSVPGLITLPNLAPSTAPKGASDINLASVAGIVIDYTIENDGKHILVIDCSKAKADALGFELNDVFRATLEALRLTVPEVLPKAEFKFDIPEDKAELRKIADEFLKHDKSKPFFKAE